MEKKLSNTTVDWWPPAANNASAMKWLKKVTDLVCRVRYGAEIDPQKKPLDAVLESATTD